MQIITPEANWSKSSVFTFRGLLTTTLDLVRRSREIILFFMFDLIVNLQQKTKRKNIFSRPSVFKLNDLPVAFFYLPCRKPTGNNPYTRHHADGEHKINSFQINGI